MLLTGCRSLRPPASAELVQRSQPLLGTFVTISIYSEDRDAAQSAISAAFAEVRRVDALLSIHRTETELSRVNKLAADQPVVVSAELFNVLSTAQHIARETGGSFDVTIRPLADLWGFIWKEYRFPTGPELAAVLPRVGFRLVELDPVARTVRFLRSGVSIDPGGIGKGYAVDRAIAVLQETGISNAMVKAGGDLRVIGAPPGAEHWVVQLEDPGKHGNRISIPLSDGALSTSGNYENFFEKDGRRYSHILDPRTGLPVEGVAACTVIAPTCMESDAWATACMVFGVERSLEMFSDKLAIQFSVMNDESIDEFLIRQTDDFPEALK